MRLRDRAGRFAVSVITHAKQFSLSNKVVRLAETIARLHGDAPFAELTNGAVDRSKRLIGGPT